MNVMQKANPVRRLTEAGQSVWLDFIRRGFIADGSLQRLLDEDGIGGITSNPAIFQKAMGEGTDYDAGFKPLAQKVGTDALTIYESLAIEDIQHAADLLRPVYDRTEAVDGYVSLEVSPYLALRTEDTVVEARRLWAAVDRPNVMIKVPGTVRGHARVPATHRGGHQRQRDAAVRAVCLQGHRRGLSRSAGGAAREGGGYPPPRERCQLLRQPH